MTTSRRILRSLRAQRRTTVFYDAVAIPSARAPCQTRALNDRHPAWIPASHRGLELLQDRAHVGGRRLRSVETHCFTSEQLQGHARLGEKVEGNGCRGISPVSTLKPMTQL